MGFEISDSIRDESVEILAGFKVTFCVESVFTIPEHISDGMVVCQNLLGTMKLRSKFKCFAKHLHGFVIPQFGFSVLDYNSF